MEDEQADAGSLGSGGATISQLHRVAPAPGTTLGRDVQSKIGQHLRAMYDDVVRQGVPDRFLDLLSQLDQPASRSESKDGKVPGEGKQR